LDVVTSVSADPVVDINHKVQDSHLQADHSIPKDVLKELWPSLTPAMRAIATGTLVFGLCRPDNNGKSKRLPSRDELLRRHIQFNHGGSEAAARADRKQWKALLDLLDALDAYRKTKPAVLAPSVEHVTA
jgi:Mor family transcriptional regulator